MLFPCQYMEPLDDASCHLQSGSHVLIPLNEAYRFVRQDAPGER